VVHEEVYKRKADIEDSSQDIIEDFCRIRRVIFSQSINDASTLVKEIKFIFARINK